MGTSDRIFYGFVLTILAAMTLVGVAAALFFASHLFYETFHFWGWM
jgi:hypothetical protein